MSNTVITGTVTKNGLIRPDWTNRKLVRAIQEAFESWDVNDSQVRAWTSPVIVVKFNVLGYVTEAYGTVQNINGIRTEPDAQVFRVLTGESFVSTQGVVSELLLQEQKGE
jgi:hypothetical protein